MSNTMVQPSTPPAPNSEQLSKCMTLAEFSEAAAAYFLERVKAIVKESKVKDYGPVISNAENFYDLVDCKFADSGNHWTMGKALASLFINMQHNVAERALQRSGLNNLTEKELKLDYALSHMADLVRAWSAKKALTPEQIDALDKVFNAWLAENYMRSEGGKIVKTDNNGNILMENGQPVEADVADFKTLAEDQNIGIIAFFETKGFDLIKQEHPFPAAAAAKPEVVAPAAPAVTEAPEAPKAPEAPAPETTPTTGGIKGG